jgi:hypothetical protein
VACYVHMTRAVGSPQEPVGSHYTAAACDARLPNQLNTSDKAVDMGQLGAVFG